jgi:ribonucleoside-diphosphate reductase alpha chain
LSAQEKAVYKTAFELDQRWIVEHAADRAPFICQSQSVNVFLPANVHKRDLHQIHFMAWKKGVKSLYYCRSLSIARADTVSDRGVAPAAFTGLMLGATLPANDEQGQLPLVAMGSGNATDYEECLACT